MFKAKSSDLSSTAKVCRYSGDSRARWHCVQLTFALSLWSMGSRCRKHFPTRHNSGIQCFHSCCARRQGTHVYILAHPCTTLSTSCQWPRASLPVTSRFYMGMKKYLWQKIIMFVAITYVLCPWYGQTPFSNLVLKKECVSIPQTSQKLWELCPGKKSLD